MPGGVLNNYRGGMASAPGSLLYRKTNMIAPHSDPEMPEPFLKLETVANILQVGYLHARKLVTTGQLPSHRIGRLYRVTRPALQKYLDSILTTGSPR